MNIQVNLLPEARMHKLRNASKKKTYATIAGLAGGIALAAIIVFLMLQGFLTATYAANNNKINSLNKELESSKPMEQEAATLQNNLASFYQTNKNRTYVTRFFTNFFKMIPDFVKIDSVSIGGDNTVTIAGTTNSFADVSRFANLLEQYNLNYLPQPDLDRVAIFTDANFTSVSKDTKTGKTTFSMTFKVDQDLLKKQAKK
ncbi:MAG: PilN domain-containing protein [Candidatus Saccharibacteria bacterium]|jgi:Tfp pilus assembly protein PilN|nr:PilN domain-containing protein [Patescibacteria group bacterium]